MTEPTRPQIFDDGDDDGLFPQELEAKRNYQAALAWLERGFNVVPKHRNKKYPGVLWAHLQEQRVTKNDLLEWHSIFAFSRTESASSQAQ
jgi:hypothetical protein